MFSFLLAGSAARLNRLGRWLATENYLYAKVLGSALGGSLAIVLLGAVLLMITSGQRDHNRLRDATHKILRVSDKIANDLVTIESAQRDFLLTGDRVFLEQFDHHQAALHDRLEELQSHVAHLPGQVERIARIRKHLLEWETSVAAPQIAAREQGLDPSR